MRDNKAGGAPSPHKRPGSCDGSMAAYALFKEAVCSSSSCSACMTGSPSAVFTDVSCLPS